MTTKVSYGVSNILDPGTSTSEIVVNESGAAVDLRVESNGNGHMLYVDGNNNRVGIGIDAPTTVLQVLNSAEVVAEPATNALLAVTGTLAAFFRTKDAGGVTDEKVWEFLNDGGNVYLRFMNDAVDTPVAIYDVIRNGNSVLNHDWYIGTNALAMRIESSGALLINRGANGSEASSYLRFQGSGYNGYHWLDANAYYIGQNSASRSLRLYSSAETSGAQLSAGATSFTTFSDERLKENVEPIENAVQSLSGLRTVKYHLKDVDGPEDKKKIGLIAQDLVGVIDEVIDSTFRTDDETEYMGLRYTELIPVLVKAIQEQQDLIDSLTERVSALEAM